MTVAGMSRLTFLFALIALSAAAGEAATGKDCYGDPLPPGALCRMGSTRLIHAENLTDLDFSPDGRHVATGTFHGELKIWDRATGALVADLGNAPTQQVAYHPDGKRLFTLSVSNQVLVCPADGSAKPRRFTKGNAGRVLAFAISGDGSTLITGGWNGHVRAWDATTGEKLCEVKGHKEYASRVAISHDGKMAVSKGATESGFRIWELPSGKPLAAIKSKNTYTFAFSKDCKALIFSKDSALHTWDPATGQSTLRVQDGEGRCHFNLLLSPDGTRVMAGSMKANVTKTVVWEYPTFRKALELPSGGAVCFSPDGKVVGCLDNSPVPRLFEPATGKEILKLGHRGMVYGLRWRSGGSELVSASHDRTVRVWDAATGKQKSSFDTYRGRTALSHDGKKAACAHWRGNRSIPFMYVHDVSSGRRLAQLPTEGRIRYVLYPAFAARDALLAGGDPDGVAFWTLHGGAAGKIEMKGKYVRAMAFSKDGSLMACGTQRDTVEVVNLKTGRTVHTFEVPKAAMFHSCGSLSFSPDASLLAAGAEKFRGMVWDLKAGKELGALADCDARAVAYAPDGSAMAVGREDGKVEVRDVSGRTVLCGMKGHKGPVFSLAFSPDGRRLASGGADTTIVVWNLEKCREIWKAGGGKAPGPGPADPEPGVADPEPGAGPAPKPEPKPEPQPEPKPEPAPKPGDEEDF